MNEPTGKVYLVGAGPGASDLITLRGAEILGRADVVVYDNPVNPVLLRLAPREAEMVYAGRSGGTGQSELHALLVERARGGKRVVWLKAGDPFMFARGGEDAQALRAARVEFEVVPGISSATAAPAFAGIPIAHGEHGSLVVFVTGHDGAGETVGARLPWTDLAKAIGERGTLVILTDAPTRFAELSDELAKAGFAPETPVAAIQWGTTARQKTVSATLATFVDESVRAGFDAPAVIVVGRCVGLREHLKWAERARLFGRRIVITRAGEKASSFARELAVLGAEVVEFPTIETIPPDSYELLDRAIARLDSFDWVIFTSATGVERFIERLSALGRDVRSLGTARIGAIGPATARELRRHALVVDAMPSEYRAEAIIDAVGREQITGAHILIPRAQVAREVLPAMLHEAGAAEVLVAPAYKTVKPSGPVVDRMREMLRAEGFDMVAFTSSSTVSNFVEIMGRPASGTKAAVIGPITDETARNLGFEVAVKAREYTIPGLVAAITEYFGSASSGVD